MPVDGQTSKAARAPDAGETASRDWALVWGDELVSVDKDDPFRPVLEAWWARELASLAPIGSLLELGAGASALITRLALGQFPDAEVVASDFRPGPRRWAGQVRYVEDAAMENLPFADARFDVVAAQYAFEYAQRGPAVRELRRVVRPGGVVRLLMHHPGSFFSLHLADRIRCLSPAVTLHEALAAPAGALRRRRLEQTLAEIDGLVAIHSQPPVKQAVMTALAQLQALARRRLDGAPGLEQDRAMAAQCRSTQKLAFRQIEATLTAEQMQALAEEFRVAGFREASFEDVDGRTHPLGWVMRLKAS